MTSAEYCLYDNPGFFRRYQEMRQRGAGLNEDLEQQAIVRLLIDITGADVLDIGCGDGGWGGGSPARVPVTCCAPILPLRCWSNDVRSGSVYACSRQYEIV